MADAEHLAVVDRSATPCVREIEFTRQDGTQTRFRLSLVPRTVSLLTFEHGLARSFLLKCVNDHDGIAVPPYLSEPGGEWVASAPCDLCVTRPDRSAMDIIVAHAARETVGLDLPLDVQRIAQVEDASGRSVAFEATREGVRVDVRDVRLAGVHRVRLHPPEHSRRARAPGLSE